MLVMINVIRVKYLIQIYISPRTAYSFLYIQHLERLINPTTKFENLAMAKLTHFGKIQPEAVTDSDSTSSSTLVSNEPFSEKYISLTDRVLNLPLRCEETTLPESNGNIFRVPGDKNDAQNKVSLIIVLYMGDDFLHSLDNTQC